MFNYLPALARCPMFEGIAPDDLPALLLCLKAREKEYQRGETVIEPGSSITELGLVLSGSVPLCPRPFKEAIMTFRYTGSKELIAIGTW